MRVRRGVSEILAAIIMIALTLSAFALIAPSLVSRTQARASDIANQYRDGSIKLGQLLSAVYHYEDSVPLKIGLYNYGSQPITPLYVFISTNSGQCKGSCECTWSMAPASPILPNVPAQLDISSCTDAGGNAATLTGVGTYQLFLYSSSSLGYSFAL